MNKLIAFNVPNGRVLVESQDAVTGSVVRGAALARVTEKIDQSLPDALAVIRPVAEAVAAACSELKVAPGLVEVEFGLKFEAELGVYIAKGKGEGSLSIRLQWKPV